MNMGTYCRLAVWVRDTAEADAPDRHEAWAGWKQRMDRGRSKEDTGDTALDDMKRRRARTVELRSLDGNRHDRNDDHNEDAEFAARGDCDARLGCCGGKAGGT